MIVVWHRNNLDCLMACLNAKVNVNHLDYEGNTALHVAAKNADRQMITALIHAGANITIVNDAGLTAIRVAKGDIKNLIYTESEKRNRSLPFCNKETAHIRESLLLGNTPEEAKSNAKEACTETFHTITEGMRFLTDHREQFEDQDLTALLLPFLLKTSLFVTSMNKDSEKMVDVCAQLLRNIDAKLGDKEAQSLGEHYPKENSSAKVVSVVPHSILTQRAATIPAIAPVALQEPPAIDNSTTIPNAKKR
jgi:hypothetical protein